MKFSEKVKLGQWKNLIMTYHGQIMGQDFFAYIKCTAIGVKLLHEDYDNDIPRALEEYGEVIYSDTIPDPDAQALEFLKSYIDKNGGELM